MNPFTYASWMQKAIRRGMRDQALYAALGLFNFAIQGRGQPIMTFLRNRLCIIAIEDVGLANPALVDAVLEKLEHEPYMADLAGIVLALCESKKTRLCSWLKNACGRSVCPVDLGPYESAKLIFSTPPKKLLRTLVYDCSPLSRWVTENVTKKEWIFGATLLQLRGPYQALDIPTYDCTSEIRAWADTPIELEGEMRNLVMDIHTGKRKKTDQDARYDFALNGTSMVGVEDPEYWILILELDFAGAFIENEAILHPCHVGLKEYYIECKRTGDEGHYPTVKFDHIDSELFSPYGFLIGCEGFIEDETEPF